MNLTKALKHKKKLVKQAEDMYVRFSKYNSIEKGNVGYDPAVAYESWINLTNELIELKTKMHNANALIASKIFRLGELKSMASKLRIVDTKEGLHRDRYSASEPIEYVAYMNLFARDSRIKELEEEIEQLQEEIEVYNAMVKI